MLKNGKFQSNVHKEGKTSPQYDTSNKTAAMKGFKISKECHK